MRDTLTPPVGGDTRLVVSEAGLGPREGDGDGGDQGAGDADREGNPVRVGGAPLVDRVAGERVARRDSEQQAGDGPSDRLGQALRRDPLLDARGDGHQRRRNGEAAEEEDYAQDRNAADPGEWGERDGEQDRTDQQAALDRGAPVDRAVPKAGEQAAERPDSQYDA